MAITSPSEKIWWNKPVHRVEHPVAHVMLEYFGVLVHLAPVEPQHAHEERLEDPVAPHHAQRLALALGGEPGGAAMVERHQPLVRETREHVGDARRRHAEVARQRRDRDRRVAHELEQCLEVVLARAGQRGHARGF